MLVLGYKAASEQFGPRELLDLAVEAENCGFDAVSVSDHFHPWRNDDVQCFFVWSWLGTLGERTQRIQFGTGVTSPILRYNPAVLAEAASTLDVMYPGRFWLGLGTGEALNDTATTGCWPDYPERRARLVEAIEIMRRLWAGTLVRDRDKYGVYDPRDLQREGELFSDQTIAGNWLISDDPDQHIALAERYIQLGFTHLFFHDPGSNQRTFLQFYGQHVLPKLRAKYGGAMPRRRVA